MMSMYCEPGMILLLRLEGNSRPLLSRCVGQAVGWLTSMWRLLKRPLVIQTHQRTSSLIWLGAATAKKCRSAKVMVINIPRLPSYVIDVRLLGRRALQHGNSLSKVSTVYVSVGLLVPHQQLLAFEECHTENAQKGKLRYIVDNCATSHDPNVWPKIYEGLAASERMNKELETFVFRSRVTKTLDLGLTKPGDTKLELIEFCWANLAMPSDLYTVFCLCHRMSDDEARDFMDKINR